jgi:hypothetical protein
MIEPGRTDVVGPSIATCQPDAAPDEILGQRKQVTCIRMVAIRNFNILRSVTLSTKIINKNLKK